MTLDNWSWKPDPDCTHLQRALRGRESRGRIPFLELFADPEFRAAVLGEPVIPNQVEGHDDAARLVEQKIRFWYQLGYDAFWQGASLRLPMHGLQADDTADKARAQRSWIDEKAGTITDWQDFDRYPWPDPADVDYFPMEYAAKHMPDGMGILASISGVLEPVMWLMGYETFAIALYDEPDLIAAMFDKVRETFVPVARSLVQMDRVIALWMGDDMGFKTGTMIAPKQMRKYVFPIQKQMAQIAHEQGLPFVLHSCGNLEAVMDDLIDDVGIDAKHSFEDAIVPVEQFSAQYGDRISIVGGVDVDLLCRGTEEQIRQRTRHVLETCSANGSYILGSGNSVANYIPVEGFLAMVDEGWRFNRDRG